MPFLLTGSQIVNSQSTKGNLPVIDVLKNYPNKEIKIQDIADIEYVRLETTDDVLLSGHGSISDVSQLAYVSDKFIVIYELT